MHIQAPVPGRPLLQARRICQRLATDAGHAQQPHLARHAEPSDSQYLIRGMASTLLLVQ
jgi:hypothetical protein